MAENLIDYGKTRIKAKAFIGSVQAALQALATRVKALEDAA